MTTSNTNRPRNLAIAAGLIIIIAAVFGLRFHQLGQTEVHASIRSVQDSKGIPVQTVTVSRGELSKWITLAGTVEGTVQYPIVSNNALRVVGIPVAEGERIAKGDVIIRLATGAPSPMFHSVDKSRASYQNSLVNVKRLRNLYEAGAVSKADLDAAETTLKVLAADLQDAEGSSALIAGEAGVVSSILVSEGETVKAGSPLAWIIDTDEVLIKFKAGSGQALLLADGQLARWTTPDGDQQTGAISKLDLMADPKTHLLDGEVRFANPDGLLMPGLLVSFQIRTHHRNDALALPNACLVDHNGEAAVWTIDDRAALTHVTIGLRTPDQVEILDGLRNDQAVVLHGQTLLSEGALIKVINVEESH